MLVSGGALMSHLCTGPKDEKGVKGEGHELTLFPILLGCLFWDEEKILMILDAALQRLLRFWPGCYDQKDLSFSASGVPTVVVGYNSERVPAHWQ